MLATIALSKLKNIPLSKLASILPSRATASNRIENTPRKKSLAIVEYLRSDSANAAALTPLNTAPNHINETDGLRMTFANDDIVHMRPSGNAPELRVYAECESDQAAEKLLNHAKIVLDDLCSSGRFG